MPGANAGLSVTVFPSADSDKPVSWGACAATGGAASRPSAPSSSASPGRTRDKRARERPGRRSGRARSRAGVCPGAGERVGVKDLGCGGPARRRTHLMPVGRCAGSCRPKPDPLSSAVAPSGAPPVAPAPSVGKSRIDHSSSPHWAAHHKARAVREPSPTEGAQVVSAGPRGVLLAITGIIASKMGGPFRLNRRPRDADFGDDRRFRASCRR